MRSILIILLASPALAGDVYEYHHGTRYRVEQSRYWDSHLCRWVYGSKKYHPAPLAKVPVHVEKFHAIDPKSPDFETQVLDFYKAIAKASPPGELYWKQSRELYFSGNAAMIIWSPFILDELAGLRDKYALKKGFDGTQRKLYSGLSGIEQIVYLVAQSQTTLLEFCLRSLKRAPGESAGTIDVLKTRVSLHYLKHMLSVILPIGGHMKHTTRF